MVIDYLIKGFSSVSDAAQRPFYLALIGIVVVICWIVPTRNPLWPDETGTYWIVKDGIASVFQRSYYWSSFSP